MLIVFSAAFAPNAAGMVPEIAAWSTMSVVKFKQ
jgi:hypothetical protein